jgi:hypothetical protein
MLLYEAIEVLIVLSVEVSCLSMEVSRLRRLTRTYLIS